MLFDTHSHLDHPRFRDDLDEVLERAQIAGVGLILTVSTDLQSARQAIVLAQRYQPVHAAVGFHPSDAHLYNDSAEQALYDLVRNRKVNAIGEIGLDYHWDYPREAQLIAFRRQIRLARTTGLPIVIHDRKAHADVIQVLGDEGAREIGGVMHCFSGDWELAERCLELEFHLGFGGPVTYPRNGALQEVARRIRLDRILIETDAPFLPPQGRRGQRNESAYIAQVAETIANLRGIPVGDVARTATENGMRLFGIGKDADADP